METTLKICRLCLKVICKNEYEIVGEKLVMVKTIFMNLNWTISEKPIICCECFEALHNAYDFKSTCLTTEQHIKTVSKGKLDEVDLWQIRHENDHEFREDNKICRFCLTLNERDLCFNLEEKENVPLMLQKCLSELDLFMVKEPVICQNCFAALETLYNFVVSCLSVEESINIYRDTKGSNSNDKVNLCDVLQFTKIKRENDGGDMCVEDFVSASKFEEVFVKSEDVAQKAHKCNICDFKTSNSMFLMEHVLSVHDNKDLKTYKCEKCAYSTDKRTEFQCHALTHTGTRPFVCPECSKGFIMKRQLKSHILNRHTDKEEAMKMISGKIHYCKSCNYKSMNTENLRRHIKNYHGESFVCPKCSKDFITKTYLDSHLLKWHSDKKDVKSTKHFACPECSKLFLTKMYLARHLVNQHIDKEDTIKSTKPECPE